MECGKCIYGRGVEEGMKKLDFLSYIWYNVKEGREDEERQKGEKSLVARVS